MGGGPWEGNWKEEGNLWAQVLQGPVHCPFKLQRVFGGGGKSYPWQNFLAPTEHVACL